MLAQISSTIDWIVTSDAVYNERYGMDRFWINLWGAELIVTIWCLSDSEEYG